MLLQSPKDVRRATACSTPRSSLRTWTTAYATIDALVADEPRWRFYRDDPTPLRQSRRRLCRGHGRAGTLLWQPARRCLGAHRQDLRRRARQVQRPQRALPDRQRARLAEAGDGRGGDCRQPRTAGSRRQDRPGRNRRSPTIASPRPSAWWTRCWRSIPRTGPCSAWRATSTPRSAGCWRWRSSPAIPTAAVPTRRAKQSIGRPPLFAADRRQFPPVRTRQLFCGTSTRRLRRARADRRGSGMAHAGFRRHGQSDLVVGHAAQGGRRCDAGLAGDG